jgi:hypothetical protein
MAKKKKSDTDKEKRGSDRHKPARQMRIHPLLAAQLDVLAERNATTAPQEAHRAIREMLEREGLWPPPGQQQPKRGEQPQ